jgi:hypothetical protein
MLLPQITFGGIASWPAQSKTRSAQQSSIIPMDRFFAAVGGRGQMENS